MATKKKTFRTPGKSKRNRRRQSAKRGLSPGTLVPLIREEKKDIAVTISELKYNGNTYSERTGISLKEAARKVQSDTVQSDTVQWIDIIGVHDVKVIQQIGDAFGIHALVLEDVANTEQRPKVEEYKQHLFIVLKMLRHKEMDARILIDEHISIILGEGYVITFQEEAGDVFDGVRERIRNGAPRIRNNKADYLLYALMDAIVDHYFLVVENLEDRIEDLDDELFSNPTSASLSQINIMRKETLFLRRHIRPLRDLFTSLIRSEHTLLKASTLIYIRDVYDHAMSVTDMVETFRDTLAGQVDHYMSSMSNKMNEVMKFLTVIGSVFIPLTFIAGIYGMNFDHMPELHWPMGYPMLMGVMVVVGLATFLYFRAKTRT